MRCLPPLLFLASLAACGARTGLLVDVPDASALADGTAPDATAPDATAPDATAPDATAPDATVRVDVGRPRDLGPPSDAPLPTCTWTSTPPVAITPGDRDRSPQAVRVLDDRLWIGLQSSNPDPPGNLAWYVRRTDALGGPFGPAIEVLPSPGGLTSYGPLSLWTDPRTRLHGAIAWTEGLGCRAVPLDDDMRPTRAPFSLDRAPARTDDIACSSVVRHPAGWTFLSRGTEAGARNNRFHAVNVDGTETAARVLAPSQPNTAPARYAFDDGSFLFAWVAGAPGNRQAVVLGRHDVVGALLSASTQIAALRADATLGGFRFAEDGDGVLVAWSETSAAGTDLVVARTDASGRAVTAPVAVVRAPTAMGRPQEYGLAVAQGIPGVVWSPSASGDEGALRLTTLDPATLRPRGTADVATARFPRNVFLRGTSLGFVVVFGAIAPPTLTQVWTAPFRCVVPG